MKKWLETTLRFLIDVKVVFISFAIYIIIAFIAVDDAPEQDLAFGLIFLFVTVLFLFVSSFFIKERSTLLTFSVPSILVYSFGSIAYLFGRGRDGWDHFGILILLSLLLIVFGIVYLIIIVFLLYRKKKTSVTLDPPPPT